MTRLVIPELISVVLYMAYLAAFVALEVDKKNQLYRGELRTLMRRYLCLCSGIIICSINQLIFLIFVVFLLIRKILCILTYFCTFTFKCSLLKILKLNTFSVPSYTDIIKEGIIII